MQNLKNTCDGAIVCVAVATIADWLPAAVSLFALVLTLMRIVVEWAAFKAKLRAMFSGRRK